MDERLFDESFFAGLSGLSLKVRWPAGGAYSGGRRSRAHGSTVEFSDFREYVPGDDFRRVDWNAYARFEKFYLKLFLDERQLHVRIFMDTSKSMDCGEPKKGVFARRLAGALAFLSVRALDRVSVITLSESARELRPPFTGKAALARALDALESVGFGGESRLYEALKGYRGLSRGDGLCVVISDLLTDSDYRAMLDYLLYNKQQVLLVHLLSPDERRPSMTGRVRLMDSEGRGYRDLELDARALAMYEKAVRDYEAEVASFCSARGIHYIAAGSEEDVCAFLLTKCAAAGIVGTF